MGVIEPLDLEAIELRLAAASKGPWKADAGFISGPRTVYAQTWDKCEDNFTNAHHNGIFIAHARQDIPALIARIRELEAFSASQEECLKAMERDG